MKQQLKDNYNIKKDNIEISFDKNFCQNYFKNISFIYQPKNIFPVHNFIPINNQSFNYYKNENIHSIQSLNNFSHKENNFLNNHLIYSKCSKLFYEYKKYNQKFINYNLLNVQNGNQNKINENNCTLFNFYPLNSNENSINKITKI